MLIIITALSGAINGLAVFRANWHWLHATRGLGDRVAEVTKALGMRERGEPAGAAQRGALNRDIGGRH